MKKSLILFSQSALLSAVGIVLSIFESSLPDLPFIIPGMKLGLANIAVMLAIDTVGFWGALSVVIIKAGFALLTRGVSASIMSLSGGVFSLTAMYLLAKCSKPKFGNVGIGIAGAFFHNLGQLIAAYIPIGSAVFAYGAFLSVISIISGSITGIASGVVLRAVPFEKLNT